MPTIDLTDEAAWPDDALVALAVQVSGEQARRTVLRVTPDEVEERQAAYLAARDRTGRYAPPEQDPTVPPAWVQPRNAVEAYPLGYRVAHAGVVWVSQRWANPDEPGVASWTPEPAPGEEHPQWVQPSGTHDAYSYGDRVLHDGAVWENRHPGERTNTWEPGGVGISDKIWAQVTPA